MPEAIAKLYESLDVDLRNEADNFIFYLVYKSKNKQKKKLSLDEIETFAGNGFACPENKDPQEYINELRCDRVL